VPSRWQFLSLCRKGGIIKGDLTGHLSSGMMMFVMCNSTIDWLLAWQSLELVDRMIVHFEVQLGARRRSNAIFTSPSICPSFLHGV
jgi:hypothetical protein